MKGRPLGTGSLKRKRNRKGEWVWIGRWTGPDGQYHQVGLGPDRRVAARRLVDLVRKRDLSLQGLAQEEGQESALEPLTAKYVQELATRRSENYAKRVGQCLSRVRADLGAISVRALTRERVLAFRARRLAAGASNRTCNLDVGALQTCLRWALAQGLIGSNPLAGLKALPQGESTRKKTRRPMTDQEIARFRRVAREDDDQRARYAAAEVTIAGGSKGLSYAC